jgi:hypothetical protein
VSGQHIERWSFWRYQASVSEAAQLVNANIIHDDEQNVGTLLHRRCLAHSSGAV